MSKDDIFDYESDLEIDPDNLDLEWMEQPILFKKYSEQSEFAQTKIRRTHENLKTIRSELIMEVSQDPSLAGDDIEKATAPITEAYYRTHKKYKRAKKEWMEAEEEAGLLRVAVFAFSQRKSALEGLVKLGGMDYYAMPSVPQELGQKMRENSKKAGKKVTRDKIRKRKRREED